MDLYVDIGNTNIKIKYKEEIFLLPTNIKNSSDSLYEKLSKDLKTCKPNQVWISSVVPEILPIFVDMIHKFWHAKERVISFPIKTGIKINADSPKIVGSDLVALAAYGSTRGDNVILVNLGTATTITHVKNNIIKGVIIAAGLQTSLNALINKASALQNINLELPKNKFLGNNTSESISIGIIKSAIHAIEGFVKEIDPNAKVILSGGNSKYIKDFLSINFEYIKEATVLGVEQIASINKT